MSARAADVRAGSRESALRLLPVRAARLRDGTVAMGWAELRKLRHDHLDIFTRSVQPLLWLFVFGTALRHNQALAGGSDDYRAYLAPGVMAQAALFVAIFFGLGVIWERDVGQLQRLLATPMPRLGIVLGKAAGAAVRALTQAVVLLCVIAVAGIGIKWSVPRVVGASGRTIRFADDSEQQFDAVIWATGYRPDHSWIDAPVLNRDGRLEAVELRAP